MMTPAALVFILLFATLTLGAEKQIKLEDIERDNLSAKQAQQQQQQEPPQEQQQPQGKPEQPPSAPEYIGQAPISQHSGQQHQNYEAQHQQQQQHQILLQNLQAYQPQVQFQVPPTASAVALYPAAFLAGNGLSGNHLGLPADVALPAAYIAPQHQGIPTGPAAAFPQQFYLPHGGFTGLQFVQAPPSPLIYNNQQAPPEPPKSAQIPTPNEAPSAPADATVQSQKSSPPTTKLAQPTYRQQQQQPQVPLAAAAANADSNFAYIPQQAYNPIPKELQSYTTIPDAVYQGKVPDFIYDQQSPVSLTNDGFNPYNALYQQSQPQRPVFSSGVKSVGTPSLKAISASGNFFTRNSFLNPTRHFPGQGISYSSYRQGPGAF